MRTFERSAFERYASFCPPGWRKEVLSGSDVSENAVAVPDQVWNPLRCKYWNECPQASFGLGDAVALVAQPIAKAIDAVAGTNIKQCGGCAKRREALNALVPKL